MRCQACQTENPSSNKHCFECGAPLNHACPQCGTQNPAAAKFCTECGNNLSPQGSHPATDASPVAAGPEEGERKTITVLFADIQDSMKLIESLDPEDARALVDPAIEIMVDVIRRFDGRVVQSTGDGIFALFGAPIGHEDHASRAIYAALELQERIRGYADSLREAGRAPILLRIGVNTGEMVVRSVRTGDARADYTPIGHSTSLASRLQALATAGAIVVGDQTRRLSEDFFQFRTLDPRDIKGVSHPVVAHEVVGLGPVRTRLEAAARRGLLRFVGREREIAELNQAFELARAGRGQIVEVVGEAGVGKSRLFHQFKTALSGDVRVLETSGIAHAERWVYLPVVELLQKYFDLQRGDDAERRREKIWRRISTLDSDLLDTLPYLHSLLGVPDADDPMAQKDREFRKQRTQDALKRLLIRESLAGPLLLIFEDLHWFDSESLELLKVLADSLAGLPVLMLVNDRPQFEHGLRAKSYYRQIWLNPLDSGDAEEILETLLTNAAELRPFQDMIIRKSEGNPLFIEEIVRALFENGTIVREGDRVRVTREEADISIPATIEGIISARLDQLPPQEKSLLQALAVIGEEVPLPVALHALGRPHDELVASLARLQSAEFIFERPSATHTEYIFKHALIHDVAYKSVLQERRRVLHGKAAEAIEALYADRLDDHLGKLVRHYRMSGNGPKTVHYLHQAGQHAYERSAVAEALSHFNSALETIAKLPSDRAITELEIALQISLGNSLMSTGGFAATGTAKAFERARELCGRVGDSSQLVPALFGLWAFHNFGGKLGAARELGKELLALAERRRDPATQLMAHTSLGITLAYSGMLASALEHCTQGTAVFGPRQPLPAFLAQARSSCQTWLAQLLALTGRADAALREIKQAIEFARESKQTVALHNALIGAGVVGAVLADSAAAKASSQELLELCRQEGFPGGLSWAQIQLGYATVLEGAPDAGIEHMLRGLAAVRATGARASLAQGHCWLADAYLSAGRPADASGALAEAFAVMEEIGERMFEAELHRVEGEIALCANPADYGGAERAFRAALATARNSGAALWELRAATSLGDLMLRQGRHEEAANTLVPVFASLPDAGFANLRRARAVLDRLDV